MTKKEEIEKIINDNFDNVDSRYATYDMDKVILEILELINK